MQPASKEPFETSLAHSKLGGNAADLHWRVAVCCAEKSPQWSSPFALLREFDRGGHSARTCPKSVEAQ
jgi:hypothetical protein